MVTEMENVNWKKVSRYAVLVVAILLPHVITNTYNQHVLILTLVFATLGSAWNIIGGYAGQVSFGNAIFFAVGGYTSSIMFVKLGISPWIGMIVGGILAALLGALIGFPCFRLRSFYFTIATIALLQIIEALATKFELIGGATGLLIPLMDDGLSIMQFSSKLPYYYIILGILIATILVVSHISRTKIGYYLRAIKMNQEAAESLGIDVQKYKLIAFTICAFITAVTGTFYAQYLSYLEPSDIITVDLSLLMALVAVFGGVETVWGPIIGAVILIPLSEYSRSLLGGTGSGIHLIVYGMLVLIMALYQPYGMIGIISDWKLRKADG